jgi:hypothetical protein
MVKILTKPLTAAQSKVAKELPEPINILWHLLIEKGVVTRTELTRMAFELSGLTEDEFAKKMKILEGE